MNDNRFCIILAGGIGSRLWPTSTKEKPKQFIDLLGTGETLLQTTYRRYRQFISPDNIIILTNHSYAHYVQEQIPELSADNLLLEPIRRNTVSSAAWGAIHAIRKNPDATLIITPADQKIDEQGDAFRNDILRGFTYAESHNRLLSVGVTPTRPDTNYGYIQMAEHASDGIYKVKSFSEKPSEDFAHMFLDSGEFLWNTSIFIFRANTFLHSLSEVSTTINDIIQKMNHLMAEHQPIHDVVMDTYAHCPNNTIEQIFLDKTINADVMHANFVWEDIGSWSQLYSLLPKQDNNNVVLTKKSLLHNCEGCIVNAPSDKLIVAQDLKDYVIIADNDVIMICKKEDQQAVRNFVNDVDLIRS